MTKRKKIREYHSIHALQKRHPEIELRPDPIRIRPYSVDHDLLLVDVILALGNKFPDHKIIHGELYFTSQRPSGLKPDAILVSTKDNGVVAIELELTAKSERRYRELILKYRLSKEFSKVIYITSHQQIENKIKAILGSSQAIGRFEFLQLKDVLGSKDERKTLLDNSVENNNLAHQYDEGLELTV